MNNRAVLFLFLGILLITLPLTLSLLTSDGETLDDREIVFNVTTMITDDVKESTFTIKLKCRPLTKNLLACRLYDPKYHTSYHKTSNINSSFCNDEEYLTAVSSYVGNFEIKFHGAFIDGLTVSSGTSLKQLSLYRIIANHLFLGLDVTEKSEGTYSMYEESVYGKCEVLTKIVKKPSTLTTSVKRTRNLETCYPVPGLLIFDNFFYHPMLTSVHFDIKSSISRYIVSQNAFFTSYTTEDIAVKNLERGDMTTMLLAHTTLTQHSLNTATEPIHRVIDPVTVKLPFVYGFDPANRSKQ